LRRQNSGRIQKKPSAGAFNNRRIEGTSVLLWMWLCKRCHMSYHYSEMPQFRVLFDWTSYMTCIRV
jgi:hypothetical protein